MLRLTYKHTHECRHKDEVIIDYPTHRNGTARIVPPTCEETMTELELVETEKL